MIGVLRWVTLPFCLLLSLFLRAQPAEGPPETERAAEERSFLIQQIQISGNRRTHESVILRELPFEAQRTVARSGLAELCSRASKRLMNTGLFLRADVGADSVGPDGIVMRISVVEKWYLWPRPVLRPVDRNLRAWWSEGERDMSRINYGLRLVQNNATGHNDQLRLNVINGYTRELTLHYYGLFLDAGRRWSLSAGFSMGGNREMNYNLHENKLVPFRSADWVRTYVQGFAEIAYRPAIKTRHSLSLGLSSERFSDTVARLNPYFAYGSNRVRCPELRYRISYTDVDFLPYPTRGVMAEAALLKRGFDQRQSFWQLQLKGARTFAVSQRAYLNLRAVSQLTLPFRQPAMNRQFIGYNDMYLQGYQDYVIDGVAGGYAKATIARSLAQTRLRIRSRRFQQLNEVPLRIFAKAFANAGYIYNRYPGTNALANTALYSGGLGLDLVVFTDFVLRFEWSFNRLGENGLYLHQRNYF